MLVAEEVKFFIHTLSATPGFVNLNGRRSRGTRPSQKVSVIIEKVTEVDQWDLPGLYRNKVFGGTISFNQTDWDNQGLRVG
jgi:hypothetical protein